MIICCQKIVIEENFPLSMEKLSVTVCYQMLIRSLTTSILKSEFFERARKLERHFRPFNNDDNKDPLSGRTYCGCIAERKASLADISSHCQNTYSMATAWHFQRM